MSRAERRRAHRAGHLAEWAAIACLKLKGYRILARRFVVKGGEIDIVAARGGTVAFVEVKLRGTMDDARIAIDPGKRRRISRAARVFVSRHAIVGLTLRGDAVIAPLGIGRAMWRTPSSFVSTDAVRI